MEAIHIPIIQTVFLEYSIKLIAYIFFVKSYNLLKYLIFIKNIQNIIGIGKINTPSRQAKLLL